MSFKSLQLSVLLYLGLAVAFGCAALLMRFLIPQPGIQDSESPLTARRSNQSILKEINTEYSLEGWMLKLKLQYFGDLMGTADSLEKDPEAEKDWRQKEKRAKRMRCRMASPMQWTWTRANSGGCRGTGNHGGVQCTGSQRVGHDWATEQQPNQGSNPRPRQWKHSLILGQPGNSQYFSI